MTQVIFFPSEGQIRVQLHEARTLRYRMGRAWDRARKRPIRPGVDYLQARLWLLQMERARMGS